MQSFSRMTAAEWDRYVACADCDRVFDAIAEPVFLIEDDDCLCLECATRRGALYDVPHELWVRAPDLSGLE
jgi:hypothetical protein